MTSLFSIHVTNFHFKVSLHSVTAFLLHFVLFLFLAGLPFIKLSNMTSFRKLWNKKLCHLLPVSFGLFLAGGILCRRKNAYKICWINQELKSRIQKRGARRKMCARFFSRSAQLRTERKPFYHREMTHSVHVLKQK